MNTPLTFRFLAIASSICLLAQLASPASGQTDPETAARLAIRDISLESGGMLRGQIVDRTGRPLESSVALWRGTDELARTRSDRQGRFAIPRASAGVYRLVTDSDVVLCRLWAPKTAPPAAKEVVTVFAGGVVRGQCGCGFRSRCNACCGDGGVSYSGGGNYAYSGGGPAVPEPPAVSPEELRAFAPDLPDEQFAALTRADVVIVNPEHISMVIRFNSDGSATVVAKGGDDLALQIQSVARNAGVPVVRNQQLAQALYAEVGVGQAVPAQYLEQLSQIMAELSAAAPAGGFEPSFVGDPGPGFQPAINSNLLIGAGIIGAGVAIPVALSNDDEPEDRKQAS